MRTLDKKFSIAIFFLVVLSGAFFYLVSIIYTDLQKPPIILNVTSDIHAGSQKIRDYEKYTKGNIIFPAQGVSYFEKFLQESGDIYLALGDNTNNCSKNSKYVELLRQAVEREKKHAYFGFGNHDCDPVFTEYLSDEKYYFVDKENWRLIVLNSEEVSYKPGVQGFGGFSDEQLDWLEKALSGSQNIVIASSKPAFDKDLTTRKENWTRFFEIVENHPNIKHILGGDYHVFHETKTYNGIQYHFVQALTLQGSEGRFLQLSLDTSIIRQQWRSWYNRLIKK